MAGDRRQQTAGNAVAENGAAAVRLNRGQQVSWQCAAVSGWSSAIVNEDDTGGRSGGGGGGGGRQRRIRRAEGGRHAVKEHL